MKCKNCGATENIPYKELKQYLTELGMTKETIDSMIKEVVSSTVKSSLSDKIEPAVTNLIRQILGQYDFRKSLENAVKDNLYNMMMNDFTIKIVPKEKE